MLLSSVVVMLVSGVFLVQNRYYAVQVSRSQAHDNARMVTELIGSELRAVMNDGVVVAENHRLVIRSPMLLFMVCDQQDAILSYVHLDGGENEVDTLEVSGFAQRSEGGSWTYYDDATWSDIGMPGSGGPSAAIPCAAAGADTAGITDEFMQMMRLRDHTGVDPAVGDVFMLYREVEYRFEPSTMDPTAIALYRGVDGRALTEYATGMDATAQFLYRTGGSTYVTSVSGSDLDDIDAIRVVARARTRVQAGGAEDVIYGWSVNVPLGNAG